MATWKLRTEDNQVAAGIEALVFEAGACDVPRMPFLKVVRTFHAKENITIAADGSGLRIEGTWPARCRFI